MISSCEQEPALMTAQKLEILHLAGAVGRSSFGVGAIVVDLALAQRAQGANTTIWSADRPDEAELLRQSNSLGEVHYQAYPVVGPYRYCFSPAMERAVTADGNSRFSIVHQHGVWPLTSRSTMLWRQRFQGITVIAPHGELDPYALNRSRYKKAVASLAYARKNLEATACMHATGENEVAAFRDFGLKSPIALIPNGVSQECFNATGNRERFLQQQQLPSDGRYLLYVSRVTPKKGLPLLFDAIANSQAEMAGWRLLIAGPDEFGHVKELNELAAQLKIESHIQFLGPIFGQDKRDAFAAADLFVLPSHSEGNPMTVFEALAAGVPVLTTRACPCRHVEEHNAGWWVPAEKESIADALRDALATARTELSRMGARGQECIRDNFTWEQQAEKTLRLYQWLCGRADRPDFVFVD